MGQSGSACSVLGEQAACPMEVLAMMQGHQISPRLPTNSQDDAGDYTNMRTHTNTHTFSLSCSHPPTHPLTHAMHSQNFVSECVLLPDIVAPVVT